MSAPPTAVLLDLDGVIRHFDPDLPTALEAANGLEPGALMAAAFEPDRIGRLTTGKISRAEWQTEIGQAVGKPAAAVEWLADTGRIDQELIDVVDQLRAAGVQVAVLTNGTDTILAELTAHGIADRFDGVFSTADIGFAKPDPRAFRFVCSEMDWDPATVFFTDDSPSKLTGATDISMTARPFRDVNGLRADLAELGVLI